MFLEELNLIKVKYKSGIKYSEIIMLTWNYVLINLFLLFIIL